MERTTGNNTPEPAAPAAPVETDAAAYSPLSFAVSSPANTIYGGDQIVAETSAENG